MGMQTSLVTQSAQGSSHLHFTLLTRQCSESRCTPIRKLKQLLDSSLLVERILRLQIVTKHFQTCLDFKSLLIAIIFVGFWKRCGLSLSLSFSLFSLAEGDIIVTSKTRRQRWNSQEITVAVEAGDEDPWFQLTLYIDYKTP